MSEENLDIYRELQRHLDKMPIGFPTTRSGVDIRILKHLFTPEEAEIAKKLSFIPKPLKKIYRYVKKFGVSIEELEKILDIMVDKGSINYDKKEDEKYYGNAPFVIGMHEYQVSLLTKEYYKDVQQYIEEAFLDEYVKMGPQIRTIPMEESITPEHHIASYNDLEQIIENEEGPFSVFSCICRKGKRLIGQSCNQTSRDETCMTFGGGAQFFIDQGWSRKISKAEALEILRKNEADGLVLQPANIRKPGFICSCCGCCCDILLNAKKLVRPIEAFTTNYYAEVDIELCTGCETCVDRCQMDALTLIDDISVVNLDRCIGCGLCVPTCPSGAMQLNKKKEEIVPPKDKTELFLGFVDRKAELARIKKNQ